MKFNPITKELYTDKDEFIKSLYCPFRLRWNSLDPNNSYSKKCSNCDSLIIDTKLFSDEESHQSEETIAEIDDKEASETEQLFEKEINEEEDFEIPAFLRKQKF